jgi:P2 family phage contractile tail tube protein
MPANIIRNWTMWANRESKIGQASKLTLPKFERKVEEVFNAGMITPIEVQMGFEMPEFSFEMTGYDPQTMLLFGHRVGTEHEFMATAAPTDDDGEVHSAVCYFRGYLKVVETDELSRGDMSGTKYELCWRYVRMTYDSTELFEMDPFVYKVGGVDQFADERRALLLG